MAPAPPASPQKRVTRARAAAKKGATDPKTSSDKPAPKPQTRKRGQPVEEKAAEGDMPEVVEPLRKSARRVATAAPARRLKITPLQDATKSQLLPQPEDGAPRQATKMPRATRLTKATVADAETTEIEAPEEPAKPKRAASTKSKGTSKTTASKLRGRPKKEEVDEQEMGVEDNNMTRQTRARAGSNATSTRALAVAPSKAAMPKKKVTFQDLPECDKENQPVLRAKKDEKGKAAASAGGIRAKPVRRPAVISRTKAKQSTTKAMAEAPMQTVLTPKKVTQIAKSSSPTGSDEDELNGAKTPIRDLSQSPKRNVNIIRTVSPVKKLDFGSQVLPLSPVKSQNQSTLLSPARRPPPSPFKETLRESPKRGDGSLLISAGPKSDEMNTDGDVALSINKMLLQSPKKLALETSIFPQSVSKAHKSPLKASLLQSPPKRPISPVKTRSAIKVKPDERTHTEEGAVCTVTPEVKVSNHPSASMSPGRPLGVRRMSQDELEEEPECTIDFDQSIVDIRSPFKLEQEDMIAVDPASEGSDHIQITEQDLQLHCITAQPEAHSETQSDVLTAHENSSIDQQVQNVELMATAPANIMPRGQTPAKPVAFLFRSSHLRDDDESSEDELQSPVKMTSVETPATAFGSRSRLSTASRGVIEQNPGFTPLATQLSGWLASSPDKRPVKKYQQRGIFSPVAAQHVPGEIVIDRQSPATSRVSTEPRLSVTGRRSAGVRQSMAPRSSLCISIGGTPDKSTYFADEMAVKDLEEEIENMQHEDQNQDMFRAANSEESSDRTLVEDSASVEEVEGPESDQQAGRHQMEEQDLMEEVVTVAKDISCELEPEATEGESRQQVLENSQDSTGSSVYGDENAVPTETAALVLENSPTEIDECSNTPVAVPSTTNRAPLQDFTTPLRPAQRGSQFPHTVVSKVPLRPEGHTSLIKVTRKRSRSLSAGPPSVKKTPILHASEITRSRTINTFSLAKTELVSPFSTITTTPSQHSFAPSDFGDSTLDGIEIDEVEDDENLPPITPTTATPRGVAAAAAPSKTPRTAQTPAPPPACGGVLQGAVVFVDVHTTEGADASGIFIELLTQMGAKCVRSWAWNPRASMGVNVDEAASAPAGANSKIGITHVVYKDGGKRTLEKVRDTDGVVKCVGVGWVLE